MNMTESNPAPLPLKYGDFTQRMLAATIDLSIVFMIALPLADTIIAQFLPPVDLNSIITVVDSLSLKYQNLHSLDVFISCARDPAFWKVMRAQHIIERALAENLLQAGFVALYILPFWWRYSSTPGKMLFRLQIRDAKTGNLMSEGQAVARFLGYLASGLPLSLGFLWILLNKKRRGFHDFIAGTVVVVKPKKTESA